MLIDIGKYFSVINSFFKYNHMCNPFEIEKIIKLKRNSVGEIIAWKIKDVKITLSDSESNVGILTASESTLFDIKTHKFKSFKFSFDFRNSSDNYKFFRIDDDNKYPVHAHDYNYDKTNKHLIYPDDTGLELYNIDFYTIILLLEIYINKPSDYPLEVHNTYNKMISIKRSQYYEK